MVFIYNTGGFTCLERMLLPVPPTRHPWWVRIRGLGRKAPACHLQHPPKLPPGSPKKEPATNYSTIPRKINMEPQKWRWMEDEIFLSVWCFFRFHVNIQGRTPFLTPHPRTTPVKGHHQCIQIIHLCPLPTDLPRNLSQDKPQWLRWWWDGYHTMKGYPKNGWLKEGISGFKNGSFWVC